MASLEQQQLQIIHQFQQHLISSREAVLLYIAFYLPNLPIPLSWRLGFYHWAASLPLPEPSPLAVELLIFSWPILFIIGLFIFIKLLLSFLRSTITFMRFLLRKKSEDKQLLQLIFPAGTDKSAYATEELYRLLHTLSQQRTFWEKFTHYKRQFSLEIVSSKKEGIRYLLAISPRLVPIIRRNLLSYLPGIKITKVGDYLKPYLKATAAKRSVRVIELKLFNHFTLPLKSQKTLSENDPISYLTGSMTKLLPKELISFQVVVTPVTDGVHKQVIAEIDKVESYLYRGLPLADAIHKSSFEKLIALPVVSTLWQVLRAVVQVASFLLILILKIVLFVLDPNAGSTSRRSFFSQDSLSPYEQKLAKTVKAKIDQPLFEASLRVLVVSPDPDIAHERLSGMVASFSQLSSPYQMFWAKRIYPSKKLKLRLFRKRQLSPQIFFNPNPILSTSEISDLYHFPYGTTTKTEDLVKIHSRQLPAPLSVKNNPNFDVVFAKNTYGDEEVDIGLTDDDRSRHLYIIGQTGSGKSTILFHMAKDDITKGRGVAVIDPHGDLADDLLTTIPKSRINDCIYFNPFYLRYPIGINLLELTPGLDEDELEQEKELVCESVVSVFRRVFSKDENTDAHRIEYILRNAIYTAFTVKNATIFTVYELLNDPKFQKKVTKTLENEQLRKFWKNEFGRAGNYQVVKMVSGVTAKVGRFLFSPTARRILEQPKSTINFDEIIRSRKILICNLAEGKLGEDTSQLLGTTVIAKIQQAAVRRARVNGQRTPFYLFIDEFQNFATPSFTRLLSGGRKFGLRLAIAEQSTSQQEDRNVVNVILANTGTVICFRTASPIDERLMRSQFAPYVEKGDIVNLPRYQFYIKLSAVEPEEPFSGVTMPIAVIHNQERVNEVINSSRSLYAKPYTKPKTETFKRARKHTSKRVINAVP